MAGPAAPAQKSAAPAPYADPAMMSETGSDFAMRAWAVTSSGMNGFGQAGAKLWDLRMMGKAIEAQPNCADCGQKLHILAAVMLSQMAQSEWGTLGKAHYQSFPGPRAKWPAINNSGNIVQANYFIAKYINADDLQRWLADEKNSVLRDSGSCEDKLDYIMALAEAMKRAGGRDFARKGFDERERVLVRAAVGQLEYMANVEDKKGSHGYEMYVKALARTFGIDSSAMASFVNNKARAEEYLGRG
ncbi:Uncharacterised protein [uncultured archaeon]|nr:Uncharacterised protein [uncultured archaeon]